MIPDILRAGLQKKRFVSPNLHSDVNSLEQPERKKAFDEASQYLAQIIEATPGLARHIIEKLQNDQWVSQLVGKYRDNFSPNDSDLILFDAYYDINRLYFSGKFNWGFFSYMLGRLTTPFKRSEQRS